MLGRNGSASFLPAQVARPARAHLAGGWLQSAASQFSRYLEVPYATNALTGGT